MTPLLDNNIYDDLDHTPDSTWSHGLRPGAPERAELARATVKTKVKKDASAHEVYRQVLDAFAPDDSATLVRSIAFSWTAHVLMALPLFIYGSFLALQPTPIPATAKGPTPIPATFVFQTQDKTPAPVEEVVEVASAPEKSVVPPEPEPQKKAPRVRKKRTRTAQRRAPATQAEPKTVAPATPAYVAPPSVSTQGPTVAAAAMVDPTLPSGPASTAPDVAVGAERASDFDRAGALRAYKKQLSRAMKKDYTYPRAARRAGIEGRAIVRILIDARGRVLSVELATSSGHAVLDNAALEAARSVKHVPAAPDSLRWGERHIKVPFKFRSA